MSDQAAPRAERIAGLQPYVPGFQPVGEGWIKLNTNELPYPCSPAVAPAVAAEVGRLDRYPDPRSSRLRQALAKRYGLEPDQVMIGNGSDDVLNILIRVLGDGMGAVTAEVRPCYSLYRVLAAIQNVTHEQWEHEDGWGLPIARAGNSEARILFITSPNAPTGLAYGREKMAELAAAFRGVLVVDEAYADFAEDSAVPLLKRHRNLVITRTFSKSYGLAGLRVGYVLAPAEVIDLLDRVRDVYNVDRLAQAGALAALQDQDYFEEVVARVKEQRQRLQAQFEQWGWFYHPSSANFVFVQPRQGDGTTGARVAEACFEWLMEQRILVRRFASDPLTAPFLRISIGTEAEMTALLGALEQWKDNARQV